VSSNVEHMRRPRPRRTAVCRLRRHGMHQSTALHTVLVERWHQCCIRSILCFCLFVCLFVCDVVIESMCLICVGQKNVCLFGDSVRPMAPLYRTVPPHHVYQYLAIQHSKGINLHFYHCCRCRCVKSLKFPLDQFQNSWSSSNPVRCEVYGATPSPPRCLYTGMVMKCADETDPATLSRFCGTASASNLFVTLG
jgi:hypothetical protein